MVDDDESMRELLPDLLKEFGFAVKTFSPAEEFLASGVATQTGCLSLDIVMPGIPAPNSGGNYNATSLRLPLSSLRPTEIKLYGRE